MGNKLIAFSTHRQLCIIEVFNHCSLRPIVFWVVRLAGLKSLFKVHNSKLKRPIIFKICCDLGEIFINMEPTTPYEYEKQKVFTFKGIESIYN